MGIATRRVIGIKTEFGAQGVHQDPAAADAIPMLREPIKFDPEPVSVERPTVRLSLTDVGDIYPGKSIVNMEFSFELTANSLYVGGAGVPSTARPHFTRVMQGCGYVFITEQTSQQGLYAYALTSIAGTAPLRHGEAITGTSTAGVGNTVFGDTYGDDGVLFVDHGTTALVGSPFLTGSGGSNTSAVVGARNVTECFGWHPMSTLPDGAGGGQQTVSVTLWADGKRTRVKGAMGNVEFLFRHGDAVICKATMRGVMVDSGDTALPVGPNELHKYPPTFLGSRVTLRQTVNAPTAANRYGSDAVSAGVITGALNQLTLRTGNEVTLRENSMDPNGINYATIGDRAPGGAFNPDEVLNTGFDFYSRFIAGTPLRLRVTVNGPGATVPLFNDPSTHNQNSYAWLLPGVVFDGIADGDRDNIQILDSSFLATGGDYDTSLFGELPGNDNEFVMVHF